MGALSAASDAAGFDHMAKKAEIYHIKAHGLPFVSYEGMLREFCIAGHIW